MQLIALLCLSFGISRLMRKLSELSKEQRILHRSYHFSHGNKKKASEVSATLKGIRNPIDGGSFNKETFNFYQAKPPNQMSRTANWWSTTLSTRTSSNERLQHWSFHGEVEYSSLIRFLIFFIKI